MSAPIDDVTQITNVLFRYAELVDQGDFDGVGELFSHGSYGMDGTQSFTGAGVAQAMRDSVRTYDGSPRTKHVMTNAIVELDDADHAMSRSYFTVMQATDELPLGPILTGHYHDTLARIDGAWRFTSRVIFIDQVGDLSHHLQPGWI
jgi:3-phenylpropionate/cinnamic acid dioxygenase small subunit